MYADRESVNSVSMFAVQWDPSDANIAKWQTWTNETIIYHADLDTDIAQDLFPIPDR